MSDSTTGRLLPPFMTLNKKRSGVFNWKCFEASGWMAWRVVDNKGVHDFIMFASADDKSLILREQRRGRISFTVISHYPLFKSRTEISFSQKNHFWSARTLKADGELAAKRFDWLAPFSWLSKILYRNEEEKKLRKLYVICDKVCFLLKSRIQFPPEKPENQTQTENFLCSILTSFSFFVLWRVGSMREETTWHYEK